jgi:ankyrin repeat protein
MTVRISRLLGVILLSLAIGATAARADFDIFGGYYSNVARAAAENNAAKVRSLLTAGNNANQVDENNRTGLHVAAINGNLQIAAILIKGGAKLDIQDNLGNAPAHYAAEHNQVEMLRLLIDAGATVDPQNKNGMTPLMLGASKGELEVVRLLLARGANPSKSDFTGRDAIGWAADGHRPAVVQALKDAASKKKPS